MLTRSPLRAVHTVTGLVRQYVAENEDWGLRAVVHKVAKTSRMLITHPLTVLAVGRTLASRKLAAFTRRDPKVFVRFFLAAYSLDFSTVERARILAAHYAFLQRRFTAAFLERLVDAGESVWAMDAASLQLRILLLAESSSRCEGELTLCFQLNQAEIYVLSFVITPGAAVGVPSRHAILVTRLQGMRNSADPVKRATKAASDVSPALLLVAALEGFAVAAGIGHIVGIAAAAQVCVGGANVEASALEAYDDFWLSIEGRRIETGHYHFPVPLPLKPLQQIKMNHRARVKIRRALRRYVSDSAVRTVQRELEG